MGPSPARLTHAPRLGLGWAFPQTAASIFAALDRVGTDGFLSQTTSTLAGESYEILWRLEVGSGVPNDCSVTGGGTPIFAATDLAGPTSYAQYSFTEAARAATTTLTRLSGRSSAPVPDNAVVKALPEPGYFMATGFGLVVLLAAQKRRVAQASAFTPRFAATTSRLSRSIQSGG